MDSWFSVLLKIVYFVIVFGIILLLAYYVTKILGKRVYANSGRYMKVVDTLLIGNERSLVIVKVKDNYLLMSSYAGGMDIIKELEDFSEDMYDDQEKFDGYMRKYGVTYDGGLLKVLRKKISGRDVSDDQ